MKKVLLTVALSLGLAWAAQTAVQVVEVLDASGQVVATGDLRSHLLVKGDLGAAVTLRVRTTQGGVTTVQTFTLAGPVGARAEAEALKVQVGARVVSLEAALEGHDAPGGQASDDPAGHDAGDDHGGAAGGHGADDGAGHDAGDDHGGDGGGHGGDDGGHGGGDDHGGRGGHH